MIQHRYEAGGSEDASPAKDGLGPQEFLLGGMRLPQAYHIACR